MRKSLNSNSLLLLTLGAVAGVVAGALLADRVGGLDRLLTTRRSRDDDGGRGGSAEPDMPYGLHDADGSWELDDHQEEESETADHRHAITARRLRAEGRAAAPDVLTLETRVLEAFHNDPVLRERAIDIGAIASGVIELTGWVHSPDEIEHAITIARGVPDVVHVVDQLAVRAPARSRRATDARSSSATFDSMIAAPPTRAD